jgi:hypothetical protein
MLLNYFAVAMKGMHRRDLFNKDLWYKSATHMQLNNSATARTKIFTTIEELYSII